MLLFIDRIRWNTIVNDNADYELLIDYTFWWSVIVTLIALLVAFVAAQLISWRPDRSDYRMRKIWYFGILAGVVVLFWVYNYFFVSPNIQNKALLIDFSSLISFGYIYERIVGIIIAYVLVGILGRILFPKSKFASIFSGLFNKK